MTTLEWVALIGGGLMVAAGAVGLVRRRGKAKPPPVAAPTGSSTAAVTELLAGTARRRRQISPASAVTDLRSGVEADNALREAEADAAHINEALVDIRDTCGGEEAVLWRWEETRDALMPAAWSTPNADRPRHFQLAAWGPLARWAAEGRMVVFDDDGPTGVAGAGTGNPRFAAAPLLDDTLLVGVLTVSHARELALSRARAKEWMPRYARQLLTLVTLSESRREHARQTRQSRALLTAVQQVGSHTTQDTLGPALCEMALQVSSASAAALVRWRPDVQKGSVGYATHGFRHRPPFPLDADTLVANACRDNLELFVEDASQLALGTSLFFTGDGGWQTGSLGIVPLRRDGRVIGAIVVVSPEPGRLTHDEVRNLTELGAGAATPLEIVWEIDAVTRRASTDGLTGLVNRRAFDEHLKRLLNETDRFGQPLALILADIDHFKRINDTWGHEAGDEVLRRVAGKLLDGVRNVDVVARYGGEEFAILLPQTSLEGATDLADRLRHAVEAQPVKFKGEEITATISLGVASYPDAVRVREILFRSADRALYEAKRAGRNRVQAVTVSGGAGGA